MSLSRAADDEQEVKYFVAVLLSMQKSLGSVILKFFPCPGVKGQLITVSFSIPGACMRDRRHRRLIDCQGHTHNKIPVIHSAQGKTLHQAKATISMSNRTDCSTIKDIKVPNASV